MREKKRKGFVIWEASCVKCFEEWRNNGEDWQITPTFHGYEIITTSVNVVPKDKYCSIHGELLGIRKLIEHER